MKLISDYNGVIVGIKNHQGSRVYRVVTGDLHTGEISKHECGENELIDIIKGGKLKLLNAKLENGKIVSTGGGLNRFYTNKENVIVILERIKNKDEKTIGYQLINSDGNIKRLRVGALIELCEKEKAKNDNNVIFQNAQYVVDGDKKFIREFAGDEIADFVVNQNRVVDTNKNKEKVQDKEVKASTAKIDIEEYTRSQLKELWDGKEKGIKYNIYANKLISADKMKIIKDVLIIGLDGSILANPEYSIEAMQVLASDMKYGIDVTYYASPKYSAEQMIELGLGLESGVDISEYSDHKLTSEEMCSIRSRLELGLWFDNKGEDKKWKRGWADNNGR